MAKTNSSDARKPRRKTGSSAKKRIQRPAGPALPADDGNAHPGFPVVGIGASAGGLDAVSQLLRALPTDTGMAFVLVQHLDATHESMLTDILSRSTQMPATEVRDQTPVEPNHVYVIPPGKNMVISDGVLALSPRSETRAQFRPIDVFLRSLANARSYNSIGVILSGASSDGTLGIGAIKAEGGITFAQDSTATHDIMPRSALATGAVDFVLPPDAIARELAHIARHPYIAPADDVIRETAADGDLTSVVAVLRENTGVDFTNYKRNTLYRRITRRMVLQKTKELSDYVKLLHDSAVEAEALYHDILINVTSFFRDPEAFELLKTKVFPKLTEHRARHEPVRVWVLGCSTGEEAYSIAIAFFEFLDNSPKRFPLQVFATDLNGWGIEKARAGVYAKDIVQDVSPERLRRHFTEVDGHYRINRSIRDTVVFAKHNALQDAPFSHMDLVSCRNLLIYLEPVLQQRLISVLHYALNPNGYLWLGKSETIGTHRQLFEIEDTRHKLYTRKAGRGHAALYVPLKGMRGEKGSPAAQQPKATEKDAPVTAPFGDADRMLLSRYAPPGVVITSDLEILQFRGDTGRFLTPAPGRASHNLLKMLREGLLVGVRGAVHKAKREKIPVREPGLRMRSDGRYVTIDVEVIPIKSIVGEFTFLVMFDEQGASQAHAKRVRPRKREALEQREIESRLNQELAATREYLQAVIEQQEAANEELQSANEEVQSSNEELQSTNEELETSKEEIQSSNEELATVNDELHSRNIELTQSNNDLLNLIGSVEMPIVMLGPDLRIRRFTPTAEKMLNLIATDVGRPLSDIKLKINATGLEQQLVDAITTVTVIEREVRDQQGRWYLLRVWPYRTLENKSDGAVMVLVDIDTLKRNEDQLRRLDETHEPILVWELAGPIKYWNRGATECYGYSSAEALGKMRDELLQSDVPAEFFRTALQDLGKWSGELSTSTQTGERIIVDARMIVVHESTGTMVLETHHSITQRKRMEQELRTRAADLTAADQRKNEFLAMLAHELRNPLAPLSTALHLLQEERADSELHGHAIQVMDRQLRHLKQLVDDLMDVARITRGRVELRLEAVDLSRFLAQVVEDVGSVIQAREQEIVMDIPPEPVFVDGDPARLEQIFSNLLMNASKFSPARTRIGLTLTRDESRRTAKVVVTDQGIGIAAEDLPHIFSLFMQGDRSITRKTGGLGIGLNLAQELSRLHGGVIEARSSGRDKGSEFVVQLPLRKGAPPRQAPRSVERAAVQRRERVLVVDDNDDAAQTLADFLRLSGCQVDVHTNGPAALEAAPRFKPEAVVLDLGMPGINGFEIARRLRQMPGLEDALLIALSGYGQDDHRRQSRDAGFDHHLTKPADLEVLLALLGNGTANRPGLGAAAPA